MSDGPHRTLQMRRCWKKLAECADIAAYTPNELRDFMRDALEKDFAKEVQQSGIKKILDEAQDIQGSLFSEETDRLEDLKTDCADHPLAHTLIDCLIDRIGDGDRQAEAIDTAIQDSLKIWGARCNRQVEEHYYRKGSRTKADNVRSRLNNAFSSTDFAGISNGILNRQSVSPHLKSVKKSGLDDGVRL